MSAWSGTTNELFFGFIRCTSTNATLIVENIHYYSLAQPRRDISRNSNLTLLSWPLTASGYALESTPTLTASNWQTVTNIPVIMRDRYAVTNHWGEQARFIRLRAR